MGRILSKIVISAMPVTMLLVLSTSVISSNSFSDQVSVQKFGMQNQLKINDQVVRTTSGQIAYTKWVSTNTDSTESKVFAWGETNAGKVDQYYSIHANGVWTSPKLTEATVQIHDVNFDPANLSKGGNKPDAKVNSLYIVQLHTQSLKQYKTQISKLGAKIVNYVPNNVYLVKMNSDLATKVTGLGFVRAVANYPSSLKLSNKLKAALKSDSFGATQRYHVVLSSEAEKTELLNSVKSLGGQVHSANGDSIVVDVVLSPTQVLQVSELPTAVWIEPVGKIEYDDMDSRTQGGAEYVQVELKSPLGFTGVGIHGHIMEGI